MTDIEIVTSIILPHEGGVYTDHPNDRGGPTKWGITIPVLTKHRGRPVTALDIKNLTREEAIQCYLGQFVTPFAGIDGKVRINAIDFGVNAGVRRAAILLEQVVGATVDTGIIGPQTRQLSQLRDWNIVYTGARLAFYENLIVRDASQLVWRKGWRNRALSFIDPSARTMRMHRFTGTFEPVFGYMGKAA